MMRRTHQKASEMCADCDTFKFREAELRLPSQLENSLGDFLPFLFGVRDG